MEFLNEDQEVMLDMAQGYLQKLHTSENKVKTLNKALAILNKLKGNLESSQ